MMCRLLEVSRSGYYRWKKRPESKRSKRRRQLSTNVEDTFYNYKKIYGAPRIAEELNALGIRCSKNHIALLMQESGLRARNGKRFKYRPAIESRTNVADNILDRDFSAGRPNQKWVTDITYIWVNGKWLYLAAIMDLYSRAIVGWSLDTLMEEPLISNAFEMAVSRRKIRKGLIIHSDRGVQYRSHSYQEKLLHKGCQISMSRKGNCWDNAAMESFFSRLKVEMIYAQKFETVKEVRSAVFEYIEIFYNRLRRHSANGYISPYEFERKCA